MFTILKWSIIITGIIFGIRWAYPKIDSFIDIKKTTTNIVQDVKDGIRKKEDI